MGQSFDVRRLLINFATATAAVVAVSFLGSRDATGAQAGFTCTQVIGYSQTNQWFWAAQSVAGDGAWQLLYNNGGAARYWADPGYVGWSNPIQSPCTSSSRTPDRVIMDVTRDEYNTNVSVYETDIRNVINTIRGKYPSVRVIVLQPVVGGPGETTCPWSGAPFNAVRASFNHPYIEQAIGRVVGGSIVRGADPHVRTCSDYADSIGHLTAGATTPIGQSIGSFYASSAPAPTPTPLPTATKTAVATATRTTTSATSTPTTNSPTKTPTPGGVQSSSASFSAKFNGSTAYGDTPDSPELNPSSDWTIEAWFKDEDPAGYNHIRSRILTKGDPHAIPNVPFALSIASNELGVIQRTDGTYVVLNYDLAAHGVSPNAWHHVAATFESASRDLDLYLDGVKVTRGTSPVGVGNNSAPVVIGGDGASVPDSFWTGKIDDVRIWNVARTSAQIAGSFRTEFQAQQPGLVANWKFDEGSGQTAFDSAGTPQNVTLHNVTWAADVHQ